MFKRYEVWCDRRGRVVCPSGRCDVSKVARGALYGQVQRETGKWRDELRHSNLTFVRGARPDPSEAGRRRQRRKRADAKLREAAEAPSAELDVLSDRWSDYNNSESLGVDTVTFDADGALGV